MNLKKIEEQLQRIENNSLLAAKNVLCLNDLAVLTGLSKSHLYKLTYEHKIPFYKPNGKQIYFDKKEIEAWMKRNRVDTLDESRQKAINYVVGKGGSL